VLKVCKFQFPPIHPPPLGDFHLSTSVLSCACYRILEGFIDTAMGCPANPAVHNENAFLVRVVTPICDVIRVEAESNRDGNAPHAAWRNYDDINEYFWRRDVFDRLGWPMDQSR
jgi:callose synthase